MSAAWDKKWESYLAKHETDEELYAHKKEVKFLARDGIPARHRPRLWFVFSGAFRKREEARSTHRGYSQLLQDCKSASNMHTEQIEKDLHRTGLKDFATTPELMDKLRRVLTAFAWRNPGIGYCQAMNFIAGLLLLHMPETNAFWTLAALIEDIMPTSYYDDTMKALHVDIRVFSELVREKLNKMHTLMCSLEIVLHPITTIWFLGLFVHAVPEEAVCRVWDSLFLEGSKMLFRVGLGLMRLKQKEFLECRSFESGYACLMDAPDATSACEVMHIAFDKLWIGKFSMQTIKGLRARHTKNVEEEFRCVEEKRVAREVEDLAKASEREERRRAAAAACAAQIAAENAAMEAERLEREGGGGGDGGGHIPGCDGDHVGGINNSSSDIISSDSSSRSGGGGGGAALPAESSENGGGGGGEDAGGEEEEDTVGATMVVPEKYSQVFDQLGSSAFNASRRQSFALMIGYTSPATRRRGATIDAATATAAVAAAASQR